MRPNIGLSTMVVGLTFKLYFRYTTILQIICVILILQRSLMISFDLF